MPKVKPLTEDGRKNQMTKVQLIGRMRSEKVSSAKLAAMLEMSLPTFYRRRDNPETWTLREIRIIQQTFPGIEIQ